MKVKRVHVPPDEKTCGHAVKVQWLGHRVIGQNTGRKSALALWHWSLTLQKQVNKSTMIRSQGHRANTCRKSPLALWHWSLTLQKQVNKSTMIRSQGHRANTGRKSTLALWHWSLTLQKQGKVQWLGHRVIGQIQVENQMASVVVHIIFTSQSIP